jgi:hypothetical protein
MGRIWRSDARTVLLAYFALVLAAAGCAAALPGGAWPLRGDHVSWLPVAAFLTWRVSRGGRVSRVILILAGLFCAAGAAHTGPAGWNPAVLGLLALYAAQIALLLSPAVYDRTRPASAPRLNPAAAARARPPVWMVPAALVAGLVVTLLYLGSMGFVPITGCGPAGATIAQLPGHCFALAEGFPLRFRTVGEAVPRIDQAALLADWAQWSLVSFAVLYLLRLSSRPSRRTLPDPAPPAAVASAAGDDHGSLRAD